MVNSKTISVIGLGYVGLTVATAFANQYSVVGFDIDKERINELKRTPDLANLSLQLTSDPDDLKKANVHIIAVPTPLGPGKQPDLSMLIAASEIIGKQLKQKDIVIYESSVYPGATEEVCLPTLEKCSGLTCGHDFKLGYSPERVNPCDQEHTFYTIKKIVSAQDKETLDLIADLYGSVVTAGIYKAPSIKVAEAAKMLENTQRDINVSLVNEFALIFHRLNIDTQDVIDASSTKWNFLPFKPGLVGGYCIGVNPYYVAFKAQEVGYYPELILTGGKINDGMGKFIAEATVKKLIHGDIPIKKAKIAILGITFKENCADARDSRVLDVIHELNSYDAHVKVHDPIASAEAVKKEYGITLCSWEDIHDMNAIIIAVAHKQYKALTSDEIMSKLNHRQGVIVDIKSILNPTEFANPGIQFWRL